MDTENEKHYKICKLSDERTLFIDTELLQGGWRAFAYERGASIKASGQWENEICAFVEDMGNEKAAVEALIEKLNMISDYKGCVD